MARDTASKVGPTIISCDFPRCPGRFQTYSFAAKARAQAQGSGWTRRRGRSIADPDDNTLILSRSTVDICPDHGDLPKPVRESRKKKQE